MATDNDNDTNDERPAIETAMDSVRRSRSKAKRMGDHQLAALLLRTEAAILQLEADREEQQALFPPAEADEEGPRQ